MLFTLRQIASAGPRHPALTEINAEQLLGEYRELYEERKAIVAIENGWGERAQHLFALWDTLTIAYHRGEWPLR